MQEAIFLGMAPSYFKADDGQIFDSTKVFLAMPLSQDGAIGMSSSEFKLGKSTDFDRLSQGLKPLSPCLVEFEMQTTGRKQVIALKQIKPVLAK